MFAVVGECFRLESLNFRQKDLWQRCFGEDFWQKSLGKNLKIKTVSLTKRKSPGAIYPVEFHPVEFRSLP